MARARPPAARHTGRAALPSATFPHTLPADPQIPGPSGVARCFGGTATGTPVTFNRLIIPPQLAVLQRYSITRGRGYVPDSCWPFDPSGARQTPRHAQQSNRTVNPAPAQYIHTYSSYSGPDQIRTGDLVLDRDACWAATPRDRVTWPNVIVSAHLTPRQRNAPPLPTPPPGLPDATPASGRHASSRGCRACCRWSAAARPSVHLDNRA